MTGAAPAYRDKLTFLLWDESQVVRDEIGRFADQGGEARRFAGNEGYEWHERPEMAAYAATVPYKGQQAIESYASFTYGDINRSLRGEFTPPIVNEFVRAATPDEIAAHKDQFTKSEAKDYAPDDPTNKVSSVEGGRTVHNVFTTDPATGETVPWSVQRAVPDAKYVAEIKGKAETINTTIATHGYVLPETVVVNRAAYLPGLSYEAAREMEGRVIEEKGFTSTMLGNPSNRLDSYVMLGKTESLYKRYGAITHQDEVGAAMRIEIVLPKGTKVAPVEVLRRTDYEFPRIPDPSPRPADVDPQYWTIRDYKGTPTVKTNRLTDAKEKNQRSEAEILLGSGAQFKVVKVRRGDRRITSADPSVRPVDVIDVTLQYVGGGSSAPDSTPTLHDVVNSAFLLARDVGEMPHGDADRFVWSGFTVLPLEESSPTRAYRERLQRAARDRVAEGMAALAKLSTVQEGRAPTSVKAMAVFGRPKASVRPPLNRKTTANERRPVPLTGLEPTADMLPVAGIKAYIARPRMDPVDVARVVMHDGRERAIVQEGHTRCAAAKLCGDDTIDARVWSFQENAAGGIEPVPRGLHQRRQRRLTYRESVALLLDWDESLHPRDDIGRFTESGGSDGGDDDHGYLASPGDALDATLHGEKVNIAGADVRTFLERVMDQDEHPSLSDVHVEGMQIYGGGGLGIPRADMPQIPSALRPEFVQGLRDEGVTVKEDSVSPLSLQPTQREISAKAVGEMLQRYEASPGKKLPALLVSQDNRVLDGHHGWGMAATVAIDQPAIRIPILRVMLPTRDALTKMHAFGKKHGIERKAMGEHKAHKLADDLGWVFDLMGLDLGGAGSGNFGHAGRPGEVGGSASEGGPALRDGDDGRKVGTKPDGKMVTVSMDLPTAVQQKVFRTHDPMTLAAQMAQGIPGNVTVEVRAPWDDPDVVKLSITRDDGLKIVRKIAREDDGSLSVDHMMFDVPTDRQGEGIAKAVLYDSFQVYKALGVDRIETYANVDVGGYAWAKFGFTADRPEDLATRLDRAVEDATKLSPAAKVAAQQLIDAHRTDPELPWHLAGLVTAKGDKVGKKLLLGQKWDATLDMHNATAVARLLHYTKQERSATPNADRKRAERAAAREAFRALTPAQRTAARNTERRERAARAAQARREQGGVVGDAQRRRDRQMQRGRETQRAVRAARRTDLGGAGSGNFGHAGRPGEVGGSAPSDGGAVTWEQRGQFLNKGTKADGSIVTLATPSALLEKAKTVLPGYDVTDVSAKIASAIPGGVDVVWRVMKDSHEGEARIHMVVSQVDGGVLLARTFTRDQDGLTVHHDSFHIPDDMTDQGIAKDVLRESMNAYKAMGVDRVKTFANLEVGGYAWAKFGFTADQPTYLADNLERRLSEKAMRLDYLEAGPNYRAAQAIIDKYRDDPKLPWHMAGLVNEKGDQIGKWIMLGQGWDGTLDLKDHQSMTRFDHYVAQPKKPKER